MQIETKWNSGNFSLSHVAEVAEAQLPGLASLGLLYLAQRNRKHDEVLGAFTKVNGKSKRKEGWKRGDVGFTPALASGLAVAYGENFKLVEGEKEVSLEVLTDVQEYIRDTAEAKFLKEREVAATLESATDVVRLAKHKAMGWDESKSTHTADGEDYSPEYLAAIRTRMKAVELDARAKLDVI